MSSSGRVGVREVARAAGVSTQTVSRVINGAASVRPETRDRVVAAMAELGYRVNNAARSLGTRTTRTIGVVASDADLYGPATAIAELEAAARRSGRWIATAYADAADPASVDAAAEHLLSQGVDGMILVAPHEPTMSAVERRVLDVPLVAMHGGEGAAAQTAGAALAVEHLAGLGHRRIARLGGARDWIEETARAAGFAAALEKTGLIVVAEWRGDWSARSGFGAAGDVAAAVAAEEGPTAIVVANDQMALGLIAGLSAAGLDVPGDVSIMGFDDNPDAAFYRPALTTIRLDIAGEARRCVAAALATVSDEPAAPAHLVVRSSTAAI
ncbi:LacI family DNA-binding transcriptional regulator [Microbacterium thalassium]|nr:substrate-binding domain-containing protein [Microbacterium thalassium]